MAPTRIYVKPLLQLIKQTGAVKAMAHITGGGLLDNIPRVLPDNAQAVIDVASWNRPAVFDWLQEQGNVDETEMHRVLNCGVGMVICVAQSDAESPGSPACRRRATLADRSHRNLRRGRRARGPEQSENH